jgi:hypothetical protein
MTSMSSVIRNDSKERKKFFFEWFMRRAYISYTFRGNGGINYINYTIRSTSNYTIVGVVPS